MPVFFLFFPRSEPKLYGISPWPVAASKQSLMFTFQTCVPSCICVCACVPRLRMFGQVRTTSVFRWMITPAGRLEKWTIVHTSHTSHTSPVPARCTYLLRVCVLHICPPCQTELQTLISGTDAGFNLVDFWANVDFRG